MMHLKINPIWTNKTEAPHRIGTFRLYQIHQIDCVKAMRCLPDASIDVAIADPPYNASKGNVWKWDNSVNLPGFGGNWSKVMSDWDDMPLAEYFAFTLAWLTELKRVVRPSGSLWIHGTYHVSGISPRSGRESSPLGLKPAIQTIIKGRSFFATTGRKSAEWRPRSRLIP